MLNKIPIEIEFSDYNKSIWRQLYELSLKYDRDFIRDKEEIRKMIVTLKYRNALIDTEYRAAIKRMAVAIEKHLRKYNKKRFRINIT